MKNTWRSSLLLGSVGLITVFSFQNCSGGFAGSSDSNSSLSSDGPIINNTGTLGAQTYNAGGTSQVASTSLVAGTTYMLHASGAGIDTATVEWSVGTNNAAACSVMGTGNGLVESITCTTAGTSEVDILAYFADGTTSSTSYPISVLASGSTGTGGGGGGGTSTDPNSITFHITAGTGNGSWNTPANPVVAYVGQTLKVMNDDTQVHRMHTNGSPCPHQPTNSSQGQFYNCALANAHSASAGDNYDHDVGNNAAFYLTVIDGAALYAAGSAGNCAACHGGLASSAKRGTTFTAVKNAIASQGSMKNLVLTDDQIKAIVYNLNK